MNVIINRFFWWTCAFITISCFPWSIILGSSAKVIAALPIIVPLAGALFSGSIGFSILSLLAISRWCTIGLPLTIGLPTALATLSWSINTTEHKTNIVVLSDILLHVVLPSLCIVLFIMHPVGRQAAAYAGYWFIPIALWAIRLASNGTATWVTRMANALQSTFIAHAAGSILWLYLVPMTATQWLALIPIVAIERLIIAGLSLLVYQAVTHASSIKIPLIPDIFRL